MKNTCGYTFIWGLYLNIVRFQKETPQLIVWSNFKLDGTNTRWPFQNLDRFDPNIEHLFRNINKTLLIGQSTLHELIFMLGYLNYTLITKFVSRRKDRRTLLNRVIQSFESICLDITKMHKTIISCTKCGVGYIISKYVYGVNILGKDNTKIIIESQMINFY